MNLIHVLNMLIIGSLVEYMAEWKWFYYILWCLLVLLAVEIINLWKN